MITSARLPWEVIITTYLRPSTILIIFEILALNADFGMSDSMIKVYKPETPAESLPLDDVEAITAIAEQTRLSKYGSRPLDYLLKYGTGATKAALKDYYPVT